MKPLIADLEANGLLDTITTIWQVSMKEMGSTETPLSYNDACPNAAGTVRDGLKSIAAATKAKRKVVFHNGLGYDLKAAAIVHPDIEIDWTQVIDTLVLSKLGKPERPGLRPHALETWGDRLGVEKVEHNDWTRWSYPMEHRCAIDVEITDLLAQRLWPMLELMPKAVELEHVSAWECRKAVDRGWPLDVSYTRELLSNLMAENEEVERDLQALFPPILVPKTGTPAGGKVLKVINKNHPMRGLLDPGVPFTPVEVQQFRPTSRVQIAQRLQRRYGWKPTAFTEGGKPQVKEEILRDIAPQIPVAENLADYLKLADKISQINCAPKKNGTGGGWLHHVTDAGLVHANLNHLKAITGRPSCSSPNIQQVNTDTDMRTAWIAPKGHKLVGMDLSGIELRCLAHYLWPYDNGEFANELIQGDVHTKMMLALGMDLGLEPGTKPFKKARDNTKRGEYGWLYGAGDAKLGLILFQNAYQFGKQIDYEKLGVPLGKKRPSNTAVGVAARAILESTWTGAGKLNYTVQGRARTQGKLRGLDGRTLWVRSSHSALNLILQSAGIIIMKQVMAIANEEMAKAGLVEDRDYGLRMWVHDEVQYSALPECAETVGEVLTDCVPLAGKMLNFRCPISGEYKIGNTWAETH